MRNLIRNFKPRDVSDDKDAAVMLMDLNKDITDLWTYSESTKGAAVQFFIYIKSSGSRSYGYFTVLATSASGVTAPLVTSSEFSGESPAGVQMQMRIAAFSAVTEALDIAQMRSNPSPHTYQVLGSRVSPRKCFRYEDGLFEGVIPVDESSEEGEIDLHFGTASDSLDRRFARADADLFINQVGETFSQIKEEFSKKPADRDAVNIGILTGGQQAWAENFLNRLLATDRMTMDRGFIYSQVVTDNISSALNLDEDRFETIEDVIDQYKGKLSDIAKLDIKKSSKDLADYILDL